VKKAQFILITRILRKILGLLEPVNKQLQGTSSMNVQRAMQFINAVRGEIQNLRTDEMFSKLSMVDDHTDDEDDPSMVTDSVTRHPSRKRRAPANLASDFVCLDATYQFSDTVSSAPDAFVSTFRRVYFAILDTCLNEMDDRFKELDLQVISAVNRLLDCDRRVHDLLPLVNLASCSVDSGEKLASRLLTELPLANRLINGAASHDELLANLKSYCNALPTFKHICDAAVCLPSSTAKNRGVLLYPDENNVAAAHQHAT